MQSPSRSRASGVVGDVADASPAAFIDGMQESAQQASSFLKALAHEGRLLILCHLNDGEKSVSELERLLQQRQAAVSQQLARLRMEGLVQSRRDGKTIFYSIGDPRVQRMISLLHQIFCDHPDNAGQ